MTLSKEQKQKNFFKSIYKISVHEKERVCLTEDKEVAIYKEIRLNLPIKCIEEIKEWSEG